VEAAGGEVVGSARQRLNKPYRGTYLGSGKVEEITAYAAETGAEGIVVDAELSGIQIRNLEEETKKRVLDRTQLILDIFASRARTREGKLQVELAQYSYMLPRLMSVYTKFERQRGGIGMRGPGETKLEADRRMVTNRIAALREEIEEVKQHRQVQREGRSRNAFPVAAIVGYTSAGKSTLMNRLCETKLLADDMPFATLDPTTRKLELPDGFSIFLSDTVGFIRNLPTQLVAAFRATLEELTEADFLIHVIDVGHPEWEIQRDAVLETVADLGADGKPTLTVFNKIDTLEDDTEATRLVADWPDSVAISAKTGAGLDDLYEHLARFGRAHLKNIQALVPYAESGLVEYAHRQGRVITEEYRDEGIYLEADASEELKERLAPFLTQGS
jgi:GTP-binding protein HflX